eukprot:8374444-Alexandrium_andersonii.AAC.1
MSASLVGSEMCIRDRLLGAPGLLPTSGGTPRTAANPSGHRARRRRRPVSYTHLTLPTICSV